MLIITRKHREKIILETSDGRIEIVHAGMKTEGTVRIGIQAPELVKIVREEIYEHRDSPE
jgi:carbon storage regulator CsrA